MVDLLPEEKAPVSGNLETDPLPSPKAISFPIGIVLEEKAHRENHTGAQQIHL
jgi:hypothetical protein